MTNEPTPAERDYLPLPEVRAGYTPLHQLYERYTADQMHAYYDLGREAGAREALAASPTAQAAPAAVAVPGELEELLDALSGHDDPCEDTADALRRVRALVKEVDRLTRAENAWIDHMGHIDSKAAGEGQ